MHGAKTVLTELAAAGLGAGAAGACSSISSTSASASASSASSSTCLRGFLDAAAVAPVFSLTRDVAGGTISRLALLDLDMAALVLKMDGE